MTPNAIRKRIAKKMETTSQIDALVDLFIVTEDFLEQMRKTGADKNLMPAEYDSVVDSVRDVQKWLET